MNDKELIKAQAEDFIDSMKKFSRQDNLNYKMFSERLQNELQFFALDEYKIIFINKVLESLKEKIETHEETCTHQGDGMCPTHKYLYHARFFVTQEVEKLPKLFRSTEKGNNNKHKIFISYSHHDKEWLNQLKRHFKPYENKIDFWEDSRIKAGQNWKNEIETALLESKVSIMLLSPDFFNSQFITEIEMPKLLEKAETEGTTIISIILKPCLFEEHKEIAKFQVVNSPKKTIIQMDEANRELTWVTTVRRISEIINEKI